MFSLIILVILLVLKLSRLTDRLLEISLNRVDSLGMYSGLPFRVPLVEIRVWLLLVLLRWGCNMFNKELLMGNTGGQQPVALTVGRKRKGAAVLRIYEYGYDRLDFGELAPDPFWGNDIRLNSLKFHNGSHTTCHVSNSSFTVTIYVSGYHDSPIRSGENISGDIFGLEEKYGQTVYLTFDPPPDGYLDP